jgi:hypothetical protein
MLQYLEVSASQKRKAQEPPRVFWLLLGLVALAFSIPFGPWTGLSTLVFVCVLFLFLPMVADEPLSLRLEQSHLLVRKGKKILWSVSIKNLQDIRIIESPKWLGIELYPRFVLIQTKGSAEYSVPIREFDHNQLAIFVNKAKDRIRNVG